MIEADGPGADEQLRRIEAVTDSALSRLAVEDLLDELLTRVCGLLGVDTAAILLLDQHAQQLVTTATKGLEGEIEQGFRIAVGRGFAGRVAEEKRPVALERVTTAQVVNPILHAQGIRSMLGVPMFAGSELVGVLHVGSLTARRFNIDDIRLLQLVADRASLASQTRMGSIDRTAALALQRSLLPARLPEASGVDMAARYVPGHHTGVGGDWYDVFTLPSEWLGIVVGDVSGHGLPAAVVMGRLRSALRAYALECDDPADALTRLDRKIQHFEAGKLATVLYALASPDRTQLRISLAGHLPPLMLRNGEPAAAISLPIDPPLGTARPNPRRTTTVDFPPGALLVCYTDGLVERRGELIDVGLERLRTAVRSGPAEKACATIMASLDVEQPNDDVALLALRRQPTAG